MPTYCAPPPGNMKTIGRSPTALAGGALDSSVQRPRRLRAVGCHDRPSASADGGDPPPACARRPPARARAGAPGARRARVWRVRVIASVRRGDARTAGGRAVDGAERSRGRRLLEDDVGVRPAESERADGGPPRRELARPRRQTVDDPERARAEVDLRVRSAEVEAGRDLAAARAPGSALITPATPAPASRWPMFVLTEPMPQ